MFGVIAVDNNSTSWLRELILPEKKKDQTDNMVILNDVYIANEMKISHIAMYHVKEFQ